MTSIVNIHNRVLVILHFILINIIFLEVFGCAKMNTLFIIVGSYTQNVALSDYGSSCLASTEKDAMSTCEKAIDGSVDVSGGYHWATKTEGVGSWIAITFNQAYR